MNGIEIPHQVTSQLVHVDSKHPFHADMFKTLVLLRLDIAAMEPLYVVIEGCKTFASIEEIQKADRYFYEESTCPTNFIRDVFLFHAGDDDPHGLFDHVQTVWMTNEYQEAVARGAEKAYLRFVFPQLGEP